MFKKVGLLFIGIGVLVAAITWTIATLIVVGNSVLIEVDGNVVEVVNTRNSDNDPAYRPVVAFETEGGPRLCEENFTATSKPVVGDAMSVSYDPENPSDCTIGGLGWMHWFLYGFGALFLVGFGGMGWVLLRTRETPQSLGHDRREEVLRQRVADLESEVQRLHNEPNDSEPTDDYPNYPSSQPPTDGGAAESTWR